MTNPESIDLSVFRAWEHAAWQNAAVPYHRWWEDISLQAIAPLLDAVGATLDMRVLDVATGPGSAAAVAARRGADVVGVDYFAAMVAETRQHFPGVEFQEGDAEDLSFPANSFDAAVINFGILHFARPEQALREVYRILRPKGRIGFTSRAKPDEVLPSVIVQRAIQMHGNLNVPLPPGPSMFRFSDPDECRRVLSETGFINLQVRQIPQLWRLPLPDGLLESYYEAAPRLGAILRAQTPEAMSAIRRAIRKETKPYEKGDVVELPTYAILASATKPT